MHFFYSVKNHPKIPIFSTFINNEILRNFEGKNHGLVYRIIIPQYYPYCCSTTYKKIQLGQLKSNPSREVNAKFTFDVFA